MPTESMNWFRFYPLTWKMSPEVMEMTPAEEGVYIRLICYQWIKGSIPADEKRLRSVMGSHVDEELFRQCLEKVVAPCFKPLPDDPSKLINDTIEKERVRAHTKGEQLSERGKAGAAVRWGVPAKDEESTSKAVVSRPDRVQDNLNALKSAAGNSLIVPKKISSDLEHILGQHDADEMRALGTLVANGAHWLTRKKSQYVLSLSQVLKMGLDGSIDEAMAFMADAEVKEAQKPPPPPEFTDVDEFIAWQREHGQLIEETPWERDRATSDQWTNEKRWKYLFEREYITEKVYVNQAGVAQ